MELGICSYSFHRLLKDGKQDMMKYISDCRELGCTQLDPWNAHFGPLAQTSGTSPLTDAETDYLEQIEEAADISGLPWGMLVVDGAHIYEPTEDARRANRARAYRWLEIAGSLGFEQVRIDAGGPEEMSDEIFGIISAGYDDLIARAKPLGIQLVIENHWGPSMIPKNVERLCTSIEGLGLLFDTHNWKDELRDEGRKRCAKYAVATHVKTFEWDAKGNEISGTKAEAAIKSLLDSGYKGVWGVESVPKDGDEIGGAKRTIDLIRRCVEA